MADGHVPAAEEVRLYPRAAIVPWAKNPRTGTPDVRDILATLMADGKPIPDRRIREPLRLRREGDRWVALKGIARELADKREAVKLLEAAKLVDKRDANEFRETKPDKPGELDKWKLERMAKEEAVAEARAQIAAKAAKKAPDVKLWRMLAAIVINRGEMGGTDLDEAWRRRAPSVDEAKGKDVDPGEKLRAWVAKAEEGDVRGLVVELLAGDHYGMGDVRPLDIACRFFNVDVAELEKVAAKRIRDEAKAKAKEKAAKAAKKAAPAKASKKTAKPPEPAPCPLTHKDVLALAKRLKIKPHEGAQSPENVWGVVEKLRAEAELQGEGAAASRVDLHAAYEASGSDTVDLAIAYLVDAGELAIAKGKTAAADVITRAT